MSEICPRKPTRCFVYNLMFEIYSLFKFNNLHRQFHSVRAARTFNESNLMCTNVNVHTIKISYICLKRNTRSPFTVYVFIMFFLSFKCFVLANDPRISLHHFIFCNAYQVCLTTESIDELYVNSFKEELLKKKHLNIYQSTILSTKIFIHTISVTDPFLLQIYI